MKGISIQAVGGPEVLEWVDLAEPAPGPKDIIVEVHAAGLNYIDTYHRSGLYPVPLPFTPGMEGAGVVVSAGPECVRFRPGDRVAWSANLGSYAELARVAEDSAVYVPPGVPLDLAAAVLLQGMTAHYLVTDTFRLGAGNKCLVHAGAGGTGLLLIQMAKLLGAEVILVARSSAQLEETAHAIVSAGGRAWMFPADISQPDDIEQLRIAVEGRCGTVSSLPVRVSTMATAVSKLTVLPWHAASWFSAVAASPGLRSKRPSREATWSEPMTRAFGARIARALASASRRAMSAGGSPSMAISGTSGACV